MAMYHDIPAATVRILGIQADRFSALGMTTKDVQKLDFILQTATTISDSSSKRVCT